MTYKHLAHPFVVNLHAHRTSIDQLSTEYLNLRQTHVLVPVPLNSMHNHLAHNNNYWLHWQTIVIDSELALLLFCYGRIISFSSNLMQYRTWTKSHFLVIHFSKQEAISGSKEGIEIKPAAFFALQKRKHSPIVALIIAYGHPAGELWYVHARCHGNECMRCVQLLHVYIATKW